MPLGSSTYTRLMTSQSTPSIDPPSLPSASSYEINTSFNPSAPVLRNGSAIPAGEARNVWDGIVWLLSDFNGRAYVDQGDGINSINVLADRDDIYHYSRPMAHHLTELAVGLQLTGWSAFLDEMVRITDRMAAKLATGYRGTVTMTPTPTAHPHRLWVERQGGEYNATDLMPSNSARTHLEIAKLCHILQVNTGKTSPAGYNYGQKAAFWLAYLEEYVSVWQGTSAWQNTYQGSWHAYYNGLSGGGRKRAGVGDHPNWPILSRHHTHSHVGMSLLHWYLGKLKPAWESASTVGMHGITELFLQRNVFFYSGSYGTSATYPRSLFFTGQSSGEQYHMPFTYAGYVVKDLVQLWLEKALPNFPEDFAVPVVRNINQNCFPVSLTSSQAATATIGGTTNRVGTNKNGNSLDVQTTGDFSTMSHAQFHTRTTPLLVPWDVGSGPSGYRLDSRCLYGMEQTSSLRGNNATTQPRVMTYPLGRLMKLMGASTWNMS